MGANDIAERYLREAGLARGMRVLDIGSGTGDSALLAARVTAPGGRILGIECSAEKIAVAQSRIDALGVTGIELVHDDVTNLPELGGRPFDALVMKRVLGRLPDPSAVLRDAAALVRSGGVAIAIEPPEGAELRQAFLDAGLPAPTLRSERGLVGAWTQVPD